MVTVQELDELVKELKEKNQIKDKIEDELKSCNKEIGGLEAKITLYLKELGRESYESPHGKVSIKQKWSVNLPADDLAKREFFEWLRENNIFDKYATVNSRSLQSLFKAEWDEAKKKGEGFNFTLPGLLPPKLYETTEFKENKT